MPNNINQDPYQIQTNQRHRHVGNQSLSNNQTLNINDYQLVITI